MKKTILLSLIAAVLLSFNVSGQETDYFQKKNEFNVQIDDIFAKSDLFTDLYLYDMGSEYTIPDFNYGPTLGLGYKHHFTKGAIRVKVNVATHADKYMIEDYNDEYVDRLKYGSHRERFSAGYEIHSNFGRTQIFYGLDGVMGLEFAKSETYYNRDSNGGTEYTYENSQSSFSYGIKPFLGFKYFISPQFSISSEYHILLQAYVTKNTQKSSLDNEEDKTKNSGFDASFGPLGQLTFSFHF